MQGSVIPAIAPKILLAATLGVVAQLVNNGHLGVTDDLSTFSFSPFTALGVAISLFLGFHNNASYNRWWEARQLWGAQIIAVRNLIRFLLGSLERGDEIVVNSTEETVESDVQQRLNDGESSSAKDWREKIILLTVAQTHALRSQLRPSCKADVPRSALEDRNRFLDAVGRVLIEKSPNPANAILLYASTIIGKAPLTEYNRVHASVLIDRFCEIQAACERIHNTSLPMAYSLLVHRTAFLFVILAPFGMTTTMGWWTPLFTAILAYTFFGLDELARQIQEPFRDEPHCLALSAMCRTVEIDVFHALGREIPPPLQPIDLVLM